MSKYPTSRNFGHGKQIAWAGHQALRDYYGQGHYATVRAHFLRWQQYCRWLREYYGVSDASGITQFHLDEYAGHLAQRVEEETLAVAYAQNLLSSVNTTLKALRGDAMLRIESPSGHVGERRHVRQTIPDGYNWDQVAAALDALYDAGLFRAASVVELARSFGMRLREAVLGDIPRWVQEANHKGQIDIREGTKGGRGKEVARWVPVDGAGDCALENADTTRQTLGCGNNLLRPGESFDELVNRGEIHRARIVLHRHGIQGYHTLRAAWACDRYRELADYPAPVVAQALPAEALPPDPAAESLAEELGLLSTELGHNRLDILAAYIGAHRK
ncbi:MAG: integrase domain-containing protein [Pseudomonadota bacterium]|nr:integrase domain-containing protein [Pseudomonadota bacterium]